jgi:hypothetical protein
MGLYDTLYCDAEMPDTDVPPGSRFQTKAFVDPRLLKYRITRAGRLIDSWGRDLHVDGYVHFHPESNPGTTWSPWPEYRAHFADGQLQTIVRIEGGVADRYYGLKSYTLFTSLVSDLFDEVPDPPTDPKTASAL